MYKANRFTGTSFGKYSRIPNAKEPALKCLKYENIVAYKKLFTRWWNIGTRP